MKYTVDWRVAKLDVESDDFTFDEIRATCLALAVAAGYRQPRWWEFWRWFEERHDVEAALLWLFKTRKKDQETTYEIQEDQGPEGPGDPVGPAGKEAEGEEGTG